MMKGMSAGGFGFAVRLSLFFAAVFLVIGTQVPYLPVWLDWRGLSATEIGFISSAPLFVRMIATPAIAFAADRWGDHRRVLIGLAWLGLCTLLLLEGVHGFWPIFALTLMFSLFWTTIMPLTETVAMAGVLAGGADYGRMRLWGSLSFVVASFAGGFALDWFGPASAVWMLVAGGTATVVCAHLLPRPRAQAGIASGAERGGISVRDALALANSRPFLLFLAAAGAVQAGHAVFYIFGALHWRSQGISSGWVGALWTIGVVAEIGLFAFSGAVVRRFGALPLIGAGGAAAIVRWSLMAFDPPLAMLIPLQVLHGLTYGAAHLGAIHFIAQAVPQAQAGTAQALYASITAGVAMGGAILIAGQLYASHKGGAYWAMAALGVVGLAACATLARSWDGGRIGGEAAKPAGSAP